MASYVLAVSVLEAVVSHPLPSLFWTAIDVMAGFTSGACAALRKGSRQASSWSGPEYAQM